MPQVEIKASMEVKDKQSDVDAIGTFSVSFKDPKAGDYSGPGRFKLAAGASKSIDVSYIANARMLAIKLWAGTGVRLHTRRSASENTDLKIGRFFMAEVLNLEQIKLINDTSGVIDVQVAFLGIDE